MKSSTPLVVEFFKQSEKIFLIALKFWILLKLSLFDSRYEVWTEDNFCILRLSRERRNKPKKVLPSFFIYIFFNALFCTIFLDFFVDKLADNHQSTSFLVSFSLSDLFLQLGCFIIRFHAEVKKVMSIIKQNSD